MFKQLIKSLGRIYNFLMSLVLATILGVATWVCWNLYQDELLQTQFANEGQLLSVKVDQADQGQRSWRDIMSNSTYLTFSYHGKTYMTRYVMNTNYVGSGDQVQLLYHPQYDAFRQPGSGVKFDQSTRKSRLIEWTTIRSLRNDNRLLLLCIVLATASFFMISGVIVTLIPLTFLQYIARFILVSELFIVSVFFTYDTWKYFQYYQSLKANGRQETVKVLSTDRHSYRRSARRRHWGRWYNYDAEVLYLNQKRVIAISEDDFDRLKPNDSLRILYDESVDDLMSTDYSADYKRIFIPVFFWVITLALLRSGFGRQNQNQLNSTTQQRLGH